MWMIYCRFRTTITELLSRLVFCGMRISPKQHCTELPLCHLRLCCMVHTTLFHLATSLPPPLPPSPQECVVGLNLFRHSLYVNGQKVATGVMTFDLHNEFLIYTTDAHTCHFISLNSDLSGESVTVATSGRVRATVFVAMATP